MLKVIQDEQELFAAQAVEQCLAWVAAKRWITAWNSDPKGCRDGWHQCRCARQRRERDQEDTIGKGAQLRAGKLDGKPGLSHPAQADECEQPSMGRLEQAGKLGKFSLTADKWSKLGRQVVYCRTNRLCGRC